MAMTDRETHAPDLTKPLGITTTTLYEYVNGDGSVKASGQNCWMRTPHEQKAAPYQQRCYSICAGGSMILHGVIGGGGLSLKVSPICMVYHAQLFIAL